MLKMTGFKDADIIAYASQFVDDNNEGQFSIDGEDSVFPEKIPTNGGYYYPIMTQSLSPMSLVSYVQKYVYVPFHFIPGDNTVSIKDKKNLLSTTPNSQNARILLYQALKSDNPYQIGIALHAYADTWSHQNFTGLQEEWNSVYPWYNVFKSIVPNIGHAEVGHSPDVISEVWTDHRTGDQINNKKRAFAATGEIYKALRKKSGNGPTWTDVKNDYRIVIKDAAGYDERKEKIANLLQAHNLGKLPKYNKNDWIDNALDKSQSVFITKDDFGDTHWYNFHQAAKVHFATVLNLTKEL